MLKIYGTGCVFKGDKYLFDIVKNSNPITIEVTLPSSNQYKVDYEWLSIEDIEQILAEMKRLEAES